MEIVEKPTDDVYTNAWYRQQFLSLNHHWQRSMAEEADLQQQVRLLRKQVAEFESARKQDMAKIGELSERVEKASVVVRDLMKGRNSEKVTT